jgi:hypothetical protein
VRSSAEDYWPFRCDTAWTGKSLPTFRRYVQPPSSPSYRFTVDEGSRLRHPHTSVSIYQTTRCYQRGWSSGNAVDLYSVGCRLWFQQGHRLSWLRVSWFSWIPPGNFWDSTAIRLLPLSSKSFPIHQSSHHLTLYTSIFDAENIVK